MEEAAPSASSIRTSLTQFRAEPEEVYREFVLRLHRLVFQAATDYVTRNGSVPTQEKLDELTEDVFTEFLSSFASGSPETVLCRFAMSIRRTLDPAAFQVIGSRYYYQLPIYYIDNEARQSILAAAYERGLGPDVVSAMAQKFGIDVKQAEDLIRAANADLKLIISRQFKLDELRQLTEGYLP